MSMLVHDTCSVHPYEDTTSFKGKIALVDVWSKELSTNEIKEVFQRTFQTKGDIIDWAKLLNFTETAGVITKGVVED